jgi:hypothetical protein
MLALRKNAPTEDSLKIALRYTILPEQAELVMEDLALLLNPSSLENPSNELEHFLCNCLHRRYALAELGASASDNLALRWRARYINIYRDLITNYFGE